MKFSNISKLSKRSRICKGVSLPYDVWLRIDKDKRDISRSKFMQRLIEKAYSTTGSIEMDNYNQAIGSHDSSPPRHNVSCEPSTHNPLETGNNEYEEL